jgi:adenylate cyclase
MAEHSADESADSRISFRIGVNFGDVIIDGDDIFGDGVHIAPRLEGLAEPGGICISRTVLTQTRGKLDFPIEDLGEQNLRNIARPIHVFRVLAEPPPMSEPVLSLPDKPSLAVLPFQSITGDVEQDYFVDGMVEEIIIALSRIRWLFVIARNSSFAYRGKAVDVRQIARELGVRCVLEGSVRKAGNRVRITGQLIDTTTGTHIWADRFDGLLDDIFGPSPGRTRRKLFPSEVRSAHPQRKRYLRAMAELGPGSHRSGNIADRLGGSRRLRRSGAR